VEDKVKEVTDAGGQSWEQEYRFKCADGQYKNMLDKGFVVYENGLPVRMIGSLQDVTDMKKLENALMEEKIKHEKAISETAIRVQEKERTRIGHELHDNVNQILSTAKLFVDLLHTGSEEQKGIKDKSISYLMMAIDEIRKLSRELVTPQLHENGLISSIDKLISDLRLSTRMDIKLVHDNEANLLIQGKQITLFRIIQEQLKNIVTHSGAKLVDIHLQRKEDEMVLLIRDDGRGFNIRKSSNGIGIANIYKRAKYYGGQVQLISAPGEGCTLEVRIPFTYGEAEAADQA
jgi:signal transduction histidine kinase